MMPFALLLSVALGWIAVVLVMATTALPYLLRPTALARALGLAGSLAGNLVERMRPHMWLGYMILAVSGLHAVAAMGSGSPRINPTGIGFATIALVLLCGQWLLGNRLMLRAIEQRQRVRRWHFGAMLGTFAAIFAHAYLNGALLRAFIP